MSPPTSTADAEAAALSELAELGMALARDAAARAQACEDNAAAAALCLAFERLARSVRLTFSLRSRLSRETRGEQLVRAEARRKQVSSIIGRTLTRADLRERERREVLFDIEQRLFEEAVDGRLAEGPIEAAIARIRAAVGLPSPDPVAPGPAAPDGAPNGVAPIGLAHDAAPAGNLSLPASIVGLALSVEGGGLARPSG